jgi:hypothetical protein
MKALLLFFLFSNLSLALFAQKKQTSIAVSANSSLPLTDLYQSGFGAGLKAEFSKKDKLNAFIVEASFNSFKHKTYNSFNINYLAINPGYKARLVKGLYLYGGGGYILQISTGYGKTGSGFLVNAGLGYKIKFTKNSGIDILPRINVIAGDAFVKNWVSIGAGYFFSISKK